MDYFMIIFVLINSYEYFTEKKYDKQYNIEALVIHIEKRVHLFFSV